MKTITWARRSALARAAENAGYRVTSARWADSQMLEYEVHVTETLRTGVGNSSQSMTGCWISITPYGVTVAGPGYRSGRHYDFSMAGIERARADILIDHIRGEMTRCRDGYATLEAAFDACAAAWTAK